jgi:hypothetical protein
MSIREALIAVVALVMMASPAIADNVNLKYALECGAAKTTPLTTTLTRSIRRK